MNIAHLTIKIKEAISEIEQQQVGFGALKDHTFRQIVDQQQSYCEWAEDQINVNGSANPKMWRLVTYFRLRNRFFNRVAVTSHLEHPNAQSWKVDPEVKESILRTRLFTTL